MPESIHGEENFYGRLTATGNSDGITCASGEGEATEATLKGASSIHIR